MKALALLAATAAAPLALYSFSPAAAQGPRGGPGGSFQGAPSSVGSFRGGPSSRVGPGHSAPRPGSSVRVHGPAVWWGPGVWRSPGVWHGGWWGPAWRGGWWGPVGWPATWWGPGPWPGAWWGHGAWDGGWWSPGVWVSGGPAPVAAAPAPVFIERDPPAAPAAPVWWYWCDEAKAYYPYVQECPGEWRRVPPQPVPPAGSQ